MSRLPDFAPFLWRLSLDVNAMQPDLPPSENEPIYRKFHRQVDLGGAPQHRGAGEHVLERLAGYSGYLNSKLALGGGLRNAGLR